MAQEDGMNIGNIFSKIKEQVALSSSSGDKPYIPDIIEFCTSKKYLGLHAQGINLYPAQEIILKILYRGQTGNEHVKLTKEEMEWLFENKMQSILDKYHSRILFRELVLVLGRRSGKDFMTSLIALYECMKLLELPGGSPFGYYKLAPGNPIFILTVATSSDQARILFTEIKSKMQTSDYFINKIGKIEADKLWLLTPEDKKNNKKLVDAGIGQAQTPGSVVIMSGHSNSEGLLGKRIYCLLLDEVASFKTTGGATSGDRIYSALGPATADFRKPDYLNDEGKEALDSKIVSISSPRAEEGILYKLYTDAPESPSRLAFKLPTWKVNLGFKEETLRAEFKFMSQNEFAMEFGAEFSGTAGEKYIADRYINEAQEMGAELGLTQRIQGQPGMIYYAHLDPASTSHNYALVVTHVEERIRFIEKENGVRTKEKYKLFVVDHVKVWQPSPDKAINVYDVDKYISDLARRFRFMMVTYDTWNSDHSILNLRSKGVPAKQTPYRKQYKMLIYDHLEHLLVNHQIALPYKDKDAELMAQELKCLKRIYGAQGFKIEADAESHVTTDDCCDALAGCCYSAIEANYGGYPKAATVRMPQSRSSSGFDRQWSIGRGQYGKDQWQNLSRHLGKFL